MHLYEALKMPIQNYERERQQLEDLFANKRLCGPDAIDAIYDLSNKNMVDYLAEDFLDFRLRGTATDFNDYFLEYSPQWNAPSLSGLLFYCEILLNILHEFNKQISRHESTRARAAAIKKNIDTILEKTNHKQCIGPNKIIAIYQKDALAATVVEDLTDVEAARAVLEYTRYGLKGDLEKKRELLRKIGHYVEPILQDDEMKETYAWLTDELGCCLNSFHIRHNNKRGKKANAVVQTISDAELEECYDNTYRELLLLLELQRNLSFCRKVARLREQLKGKKSGRKG